MVKALCPPKLALSCLQSTGSPRAPGELSVGRKGWIAETGRTSRDRATSGRGEKASRLRPYFREGPPRVAIKLPREEKKECLRRYFFF